MIKMLSHPYPISELMAMYSHWKLWREQFSSLLFYYPYKGRERTFGKVNREIAVIQWLVDGLSLVTGCN